MTQETMMTDDPTITDGAASQEVTQPEGEVTNEQQQTEGTESQQEQAAEEVPEQYADFSFEEGKALDASLADDIKATAKELGLTQSQAQKMADLALKRTEAAQTQQAELLTQARTEWAETAKSDSEFGGDTLSENLGIARKALDTFGTPELKALLNESGLGNHPEVIRVFYRAGKAISDDRIVTGGVGASAQQGDARRLYPNSNMN